MTVDYNMGTILGPDSRAVADLQAIDDYVRTQARPRVAQFPKSLPLVQEYEEWRQKVGWWELNVMVNDTMKSAKAKRDAINRAQNQQLPETATVEEGSFVTSPEDPEKTKGGLGKVVAVAGLGAVAGAWGLWRLLRGGHHFP